MTLTRRSFLGRAALLGGAIALEGPTALARAGSSQPPLATDGAFSLGVSSGFPTPTGAVLWTRLDGLQSSARLTLEVARDAAFRNVVKRSTVTADAARDFTVNAPVSGLQAGEEYHYRFYTKHVSSPVGRLRTLRPADSRQPLRVAVFSCQSYEAGYYTAHHGLAAEDDIDLVLCLGDYIYEHHYYDGPAARADRTGANADGDVQTLDEYRQKYRLYRSDPDLQEMHAAWPMIPIWDDHEVEDNYAGSGPDSASTDPANKENDNSYPRRVPFSVRQRAGYQAFSEYMAWAGASPLDTKIWQRIPLGANASLFLTDERRYRTPQPCKDQLAAPCPDASSASATMLGTTQKAWLKDALVSEKATWKLWANELMLMALDSAPTVPLNMDQWDGYAAERAEILGHCAAHGVQNLAVLTGDIHTFFAGNVTTTGRSGGTPIATEFVGGSITSQGLESYGPAVGPALLATNPHLEFIDTTHRGYMVLTAAPDHLDVAFRAPGLVSVPASQVGTIARFRVAAGVPQVQQV